MPDIRRATQDDAEDAYAIRCQAILAQCPPFYGAQLAHAWAHVPHSEGFTALVAEHFHLACLQGQSVATGMIDLNSGELGALFVLPGYMGRGIARAMVGHLEAIAVAAGLDEIHLDATLNAAPFYRRCGYVGDNQGVYHSPSGLQMLCVPMRKQLAMPRR
ncbi:MULTISPECIES: GNAT family N-acetyltransferase [Pseudomonas]|uniref:GNAT family N-acetyltransferase n=1 Tax=Pseudomonas mosselii TaxID=78327 RepID=A0A5R8ZH19_9PSED|nr:GNAT family N-acetyltransferase [Pseudomonas mosselii]TLP64645.1 GNAT family N-acetyltransferase [Pseudomonas mosselii]